MENNYFECSCHSPEHTLLFTFDDDPKYPMIYVCTFLSEKVWYKRIFTALKYIFGYKCKYGHFDEFILKKEDCDRMIGLLEKLKNAKIEI